MLTIDKARENFHEHCRIGKTLSTNTIKAYDRDLADFSSFVGGDLKVGEVGRDLLRSFARRLFDEQGLKEASVKRRIATLKVFFRWLEREEMVEITPFHRLDLVVRLPRRLPRGLSAEELRALLGAVDAERHHYRAVLLRLVVMLLFTTGLRIGELSAVRLIDLDQTDGVIQVRGKGNRERRVYLVGGDLRLVLTHYLGERAKLHPSAEDLLLTPAGRPATSQYLRRRLILLGKAAGLSRRITPHMLRHAAATHLVEAGMDIRFVQKLLGHASIATTQIYTQVSDNSLKEALIRANTLGRVGGGKADN